MWFGQKGAFKRNTTIKPIRTTTKSLSCPRITFSTFVSYAEVKRSDKGGRLQAVHKPQF